MRSSAAPTFSRDIAPILYKRCAMCHHAGAVAPFPLITYQDAAKRAGLIATITSKRAMPPWKPAPGHGKFANERRLTNAEIATIQRWAASGAKEGDPARLPEAPEFPDGWQLGKPDLVVEMPRPFAVPADGDDLYQCFVIPTGVSSDRWVRAMEFRPGSPQVVHHALLFTDVSPVAREKAGVEGSYPCFGGLGLLPTTGLGGWTPGNLPITMPGGVAIRLNKGADLIVQIHFHPIGKPESERSRIAFYFTDQAPAKRVVDAALGSHRIDIAPGDPAYKVTDHFTLPVDVDAVGIIPHAHYLCRRMHGWADLPGGKRRELLLIDDWDFNWQEQYHYAAPIRLPAGTDLKMEFLYDNSAANPRNPNSPPKRVTWGPETTDEMAGLHVQVIPVRMEDLPELGRALWGKVMRMVGGSFYHLPPK